MQISTIIIESTSEKLVNKAFLGGEKWLIF